MTFSRVSKEMESAGEESEDGGGSWHKYVTMERKALLRGKKPDYILSSDIIGRSGGAAGKKLPASSLKLKKQAKPYTSHSLQFIAKNERESEDGGGGWHQHVSMRKSNSSGALSRSRIFQTSSSSSDDDENKFARNKSMINEDAKHDNEQEQKSLSFEQKKQRLHQILFEPKELELDPEQPITGMKQE